MPRRNGSYFGFTVAPTPSVASGIWRVSEAEQYLRENKWPATPGVPGSPTGTPGNGEVALTWSAPTLGSPPTDYEVQYSSNAGSTWTTFTDGVGTTTSATVTGLTNGTGYIFRVRALNALGDGPYGSASGTITPLAVAVDLLLHFDGTNGSTTFTDSSDNDLAVTAYGDVEISTTQSKFGGASGLFDGDGDYLVVGGSVGALGDGDFTIDFWARPEALQDYAVFLGNFVGAANNQFQLLMNGSGQLDVYTNSFLGLDATVSTGQWQHIALIRHSGTIKLYVDGVASSSGVANTANFNSSGDLWIGNTPEGLSRWYDGHIDELRVVKAAMWTANFTPPSAPY